jgi:hypothetical protein
MKLEEICEAQERYSPSFKFTYKPGNNADEKKLAELKASVKGTNKRVVKQGRLGKDNPNAHKYSINAPAAVWDQDKGKWLQDKELNAQSGGHSHQRIQTADAAHFDVYVYRKA